MDDLLEFINGQPLGVSPIEIEEHTKLSRTTLTRRLNAEIKRGTILKFGKGPATRYVSSDPLGALKAYFEKPYTERSVAPYSETLLAVEPGLSQESVSLFAGLPSHMMTKRELAKFLIDFSCASSVLEGGTYSLLDTQALLEYGERATEKPDEDAFLVLNHKEAFEFLFDNPELSSVLTVHDLLTSDHGVPGLDDSRHFLSKAFRGVVRDNTDVDIALSTYLPPYRPGTGYVGEMLSCILARAEAITNPVQAAFYLLTRIAYLQPFKDGNKRTARAMCNVPLLKAGLPPISFMDFGKRDYIVAMLCFYELGDIRLAERCFVDAYSKSVARLGIKK